MMMTGRVTGHLLKHPDKDEDGKPMLGSGPVTIQFTLEDEVGHRCRSELVIDPMFAVEYPIGSVVSVEAKVLQLEMHFAGEK